jgi:hypothetical protein
LEERTTKTLSERVLLIPFLSKVDNKNSKLDKMISRLVTKDKRKNRNCSNAYSVCMSRNTFFPYS